jgi:hypothetical protein
MSTSSFNRSAKEKNEIQIKQATSLLFPLITGVNSKIKEILNDIVVMEHIEADTLYRPLRDYKIAREIEGYLAKEGQTRDFIKNCIQDNVGSGRKQLEAARKYSFGKRIDATKMTLEELH